MSKSGIWRAFRRSTASFVSSFQLPRPVDFYQIDGAPQTSISLIYLKDRLEARAVAALTQIGKAAFGETEL